jgi:hypothetical protein
MKNKLQILVTVIFLGFVVWWASFQHVVKDQGVSVQWFGATYGAIALIGSIIGFVAAHKWGGFKTVLGKALTFFSLGLLAQEAGQLIYAYYIYGAKIQIPFPSWGDAAYFGSVILYIIAAFYLAHASGVKFSLKSVKYKLIAVAVPIALLALSFFMFLYHHELDTSNPVAVFLTFGYPLGQALYISIAITAYLLSIKLLGGLMKWGILLVILALFIQYVADFTFIYLSNRGTWLTGEYNDLMYLVSYFALATAMIKFISIHKKLRSNLQAASDTPVGTPPADEPAPTAETPAEPSETQEPVAGSSELETPTEAPKEDEPNSGNEGK